MINVKITDQDSLVSIDRSNEFVLKYGQDAKDYPYGTLYGLPDGYLDSINFGFPVKDEVNQYVTYSWDQGMKAAQQLGLLTLSMHHCVAANAMIERPGQPTPPPNHAVDRIFGQVQILKKDIVEQAPPLLKAPVTEYFKTYLNTPRIKTAIGRMINQYRIYGIVAPADYIIVNSIMNEHVMRRYPSSWALNWVSEGLDKSSLAPGLLLENDGIAYEIYEKSKVDYKSRQAAEAAEAGAVAVERALAGVGVAEEAEGEIIPESVSGLRRSVFGI